MLLTCAVSKEIWSEIDDWIVELGMQNCTLFPLKIIPGDLGNALAINSIILLTQKTIYNALKKEQKPH